MNTASRVALRALSSAGILLLLPLTAAAQEFEERVSIGIHGGLAVPAGALSDIGDVGGTVGGGLSYYFLEHLGVRLDVTGEFLDDRLDTSGAVPSPPMNLVHVHTGVEVDFPAPEWQRHPMTFRVNAGGGITSVSADGVFDDGSEVDFSETYPSLTAGGRVGYQATPTVSVFVAGQAFLTFFDEEDTQVFADRSLDVDTFSTTWSIPVTLGVAFTF